MQNADAGTGPPTKPTKRDGAQTTESPWMTTLQVAAYVQMHQETVLEALQSGELKGSQRKARAPWRVHIDDVIAWLNGETPAKKRRAKTVA